MGSPVSQPQTARRALLDAFAALALSRRYHEFGAGLIAQQANVARSTFYYHFKSKDELLVQNLAPMFAALSRLVLADAATPEVEGWVRHVWEYRTHATRMFAGATGRRIAEALAREVRLRLETRTDDPLVVRLAPLLADQITGGMLGLLRGWTSGRSTASAEEVAWMLWAAGRSATTGAWLSESR